MIAALLGGEKEGPLEPWSLVRLQVKLYKSGAANTLTTPIGYILYLLWLFLLFKTI